MPILHIPYSSLSSLVEIDQFYTENKAFFCNAGRYFEVYTCKGGYELVTHDTLARQAFQYAQRQNVTSVFLSECIYILQSLDILDELEYSKVYSEPYVSLPHYLFYLVSQDAKCAIAVDPVGQGRSHISEAADHPVKKSLPCNENDLVTISSNQDRLSLSLFTHALKTGDAIFITYANLDSLDRFCDFLCANRAFFEVGEKYFEAFLCSGGYVLLSKQLAHEEPLYKHLKNVTHDFIACLVAFFEGSSVLHSIDNAQKYGCFLLHYLFWLTLNSFTSTLSAFNASQMMASQSKPFLALMHQPSCASLFHTVMLANDCSPEMLPMHARLVLEVPSGRLSRSQLEYVLDIYAKSAWRYFTCVSTDFNRTTSVFKNFYEAQRYNYQYLHKDDSKAQLELIIKRVSEDRSYTISLRNVYFDVLLYSTNIHQAMMFLEEASEPLVFYKGDILLAKSESFNWNECLPSNNVVQFGGVTLPYEKFDDCSEHGLLVPCKQLDADRLCLQLNISRCSDQLPVRSSFYEIVEDQMQKLRSSQKNTTPFIPPIEQLLVANSNAMHVSYSAIFRIFYEQPDKLHLLNQKCFAHWFLETPVKEVNVAMLSLLRRVQEKEAFTLPATAEIVTIIQHFTSYLLGCSADSSMIAPYLKESSSLARLIAAKRILKSCTLSFPQDESCREMQAVYKDLLALHKACALLPVKDKCIEATSCMEEHFSVRLSDSMHNKPYSPTSTAFLITRFLYALTKVYTLTTLESEDISKELECCEILICKGILPLFMLQSEVDIPQLNKACCLPIGVVGVTFDLHNKHDGTDYTPARLWVHDYLFHTLFINSILDSHWKLLQIEERVLLMHNIEAMRNNLSEKEADYFTFANESIGAKQLLQVFDLLYFNLVHEKHSRGRTHARTCMLPSAFPHTFFEKTNNYFNWVDSDNPAALTLTSVFEDFTEDMRALLPLEGNSSFPYFVAYLMLDSIIEQTRHAKLQADEVSVDALLAAFEAKLEEQEQLLYLYEQNWNILVDNGVLYPSCADITSSVERLRVLATPYFQERVRKFPMSFPLINTITPGSETRKRNASFMEVEDDITTSKKPMSNVILL